jgi:RNA polymerase sigma factor for flagellar operon FliA
VIAQRAHARYAASAEDALVARHAALIARVGRRIAARTGGAVAAEDLWSAGAVGLLEAARRFDAGRDVGFEAFAEHRIKGAMLDELRRMDHLPRRLRSDLDQVEAARARLGQDLGRDPEAAEIAADLGLPIDDVQAMQSLALPPLGPEGLELLPSAEPRGDEAAMRRQALRAVTDAIAGLPDRLQLVLSLHYVEELSYREIAQVLKVSEPRVCQLHGEAMKLVRARVGEGAA